MYLLDKNKNPLLYIETKEQETQDDIKELLNELAKIDENKTRTFEKM